MIMLLDFKQKVDLLGEKIWMPLVNLPTLEYQKLEYTTTIHIPIIYIVLPVNINYLILRCN